LEHLDFAIKEFREMKMRPSGAGAAAQGDTEGVTRLAVWRSLLLRYGKWASKRSEVPNVIEKSVKRDEVPLSFSSPSPS
jgi:hypothetical protein